jgi:hypothetical protein
VQFFSGKDYRTGRKKNFVISYMGWLCFWDVVVVASVVVGAVVVEAVELIRELSCHSQPLNWIFKLFWIVSWK